MFRLLLVVLAVSAAYATNYCSSDICNSGTTHIACGHNHQFASTCPSDAQMVTMTPALKTLVVHAHNEKRNIIAGGGDPNHSKACRMATMSWDDELAEIAALNVMQCKMAHDRCRNTDAFKYSGQNLAWMGYFDPINHSARLQQSVDMWYSEVKDSNMTYINSYPNNYQGPAIGHFTVMVADKNIKVGCAASYYSVPGATYKAYLVACNYATTNIINFPMYAACATTGEKCTTGTNSAYPNLCSATEHYDVNKLW